MQAVWEVEMALVWEMLTQGVPAAWLVAIPPTFLASYFMTQKLLVPKSELPGTVMYPVGQFRLGGGVPVWPLQGPSVGMPPGAMW